VASHHTSPCPPTEKKDKVITGDRVNEKYCEEIYPAIKAVKGAGGLSLEAW
jgi:hypothetical protein